MAALTCIFFPLTSCARVRNMVLPNIMSSIVSKLIAGHAYYYLVESARVNGKPRIVSQVYLGSAEEVHARLSGTGPGVPDRSRHLAFGDMAATWSILSRLHVSQIVDEVAGARRKDAGASTTLNSSTRCSGRSSGIQNQPRTSFGLEADF